MRAAAADGTSLPTSLASTSGLGLAALEKFQTPRRHDARGCGHLPLAIGALVKKAEPPNQEEFDAMLAWLDAEDRDHAAVLFEEIHIKIVKFLVRRGCDVAEELWDETSNRVCHKVKSIADSYDGDPALYFYGVAKNVYREWRDDRRPDSLIIDPLGPRTIVPDPDPELIDRCLQKCLGELEEDDRELILEYFEKEKREKINHRKRMADRLGITMNSLRMRAFRIKQILKECIVKCLADAGISEIVMSLPDNP